MKKYKYKTIDVLHYPKSTLITLLNVEGERGWEFVIIIETSLILKKEYTNE